MGDESDKLLKVKAEVSATGGALELELGKGVPRAMAMLFPRSTAKRLATLASSGRILEKVRAGLELDDAEADYASEVFGEAEARLIRRKQIQARALIGFQDAEVKQLQACSESDATETSTAAPSPAPDAGKTAADWVSKFWDDAGLVSDEVLQEVYARLLASEARAPGTCSLRTLSVLRYLDRGAAEDFAKLAALVLANGWVPEDFGLLRRFGVDYRVMTNLVEARLLGPTGSHVRKPEGEHAVLPYGSRILRISEFPKGAQIRVLPLTSAGTELYRIAQFERSQDYLLQAAASLKAQFREAQVHWMELPDGIWHLVEP